MLLIKLLSHPVFIIIFTLYFEFGSRHYFDIVLINIFISLFSVIYIMIMVPESPQYLVEQGTLNDFQEARLNLNTIAAFNEVYLVRGFPYRRYKFVKEK